MNLFDLTGKVAMITGGNGGIGFGIAQGLAEAGAQVAVLGRNTAKSESAARQLTESTGTKTLVVTADVSREEDAARAAAETLAHFGRIDILFNNAGINIRKQPQELSLDDWDQVLKVNLTSAFLMSKVVYAAMKRAGGGKIINIGSMTSIFGVAVCRRVCIDQGRDRPVDQEPGAGVGGRQYSGERHPARLVRHRANRKGQGADPRPSRASACKDRRRAMGQAGGYGGHRDLARRPWQRLHHRRRDSRRRRVHGYALKARGSAEQRPFNLRFPPLAYREPRGRRFRSRAAG